jgi:hypothetical protein
MVYKALCAPRGRRGGTISSLGAAPAAWSEQELANVAEIRADIRNCPLPSASRAVVNDRKAPDADEDQIITRPETETSSIPPPCAAASGLNPSQSLQVCALRPQGQNRTRRGAGSMARFYCLMLKQTDWMTPATILSRAMRFSRTQDLDAPPVVPLAVQRWSVERSGLRGSGPPADHGGLREFAGWGGRIRTCAWRYQKPLPYRLATPQQERRSITSPNQM